MGSRGYTLCSNNSRSFVGTCLHVSISMSVAFVSKYRWMLWGRHWVRCKFWCWIGISTRSTNLRICFCWFCLGLTEKDSKTTRQAESQIAQNGQKNVSLDFRSVLANPVTNYNNWIVLAKEVRCYCRQLLDLVVCDIYLAALAFRCFWLTHVLWLEL